MPELAEVEYFRRRWDPGLGRRIERVELHSASRIFRTAAPQWLRRRLQGARLLSSTAFGKRLLFRFSEQGWLGLHLGMTGLLRVTPANYVPARHDHLVLRQRHQALVLTDPRQFGSVQFHQGKAAPAWWDHLPPAVLSPEFTLDHVRAFLQRHARLTLKAVLLLQDGFPGIGNWMADEILWQARLPPAGLAGKLHSRAGRQLWRSLRRVSAGAMRTIGVDFSGPPRGWLFHERWSRKGKCPRHGTALAFDVYGGRTTAWCVRCQRACLPCSPGGEKSD